MLCDKNDSQSYIQEFQKRFNNFAEKAPVLLSYSTYPKGVSIVDEGLDTVYEFEWDFTIPVKSFIHGIKEILSEKSYPTMTQVIRKIEPLSEEETATLLAAGMDIEKIPETKTISTAVPWLIDKCVIFKDVFILKNMKTKELSRYKLNKSSVFFLKKLRSGALTNETAGDYFFANATFLNTIEGRDGDGPA